MDNITNQKSFKHKFWGILSFAYVVYNMLAATASIIGLIFYTQFKLLQIILLFSCIVGVTIGIAYVLSSKVNARNRSNSYLVDGNREIDHLVRDEYFKLQEIYKNTNNKSMIYEHSRNMVNEIINKCADTLTRFTGKDIYCCVKIFDLDSPLDDLMNKNIVTLCRSYNSRRRYDASKAVVASDNTDFMDILSCHDNKAYFACADLTQLVGYKNSTPDWRDYYKATIVTPIRIAKRISKPDGNYNIYGFLCADTKEISAFENHVGQDCANFIIGIGDLLYVLMDKVAEYYENAE